MRYFLALLFVVVPSLSWADTSAKSVISGVPYVSWHEAAQRDYQDKDIVNPSMIASWSMILEYWGESSKAAFLPGSGDFLPENWTTEWSEERDLEDVKNLLSQGIPVIVDLPLTTEGHPLYVAHSLMAMMKGFKIPDLCACSPLHGVFLSFETIEGLRTTMKSGEDDFHPLNEVVLKANRVIVGYDDERQIVMMHDPTFGPAWEVSYRDFEKMWAASPTGYGKIHPPSYQTLAKGVVTTSAYRQRTGNERAAWHLLHGCCLSACGKYRDAEHEIASALSLTDLSTGYRHMVLYELALHQAKRSDYESAVKSAVTASELLPENYLVWDLLGILYLNTGDKKQAKEAQKNAMKLKKSSKAAKRMAGVIPSDYFIGFLGKSRGWASADGR